MCRLAPLTMIVIIFAVACGGAEAGIPPTPTSPLTLFSTLEAIPPTPALTPTATALALPTIVATSTETATLPTPQSEPSVRVNLAPKWAAGQSWGYKLVKSQERRIGSVTTSNNTSTSIVNIEILEVTGLGFVIGYTLKSIELPATGVLLADLLARDLAELTIDITFEIEVNSEAIMVGLRNFEEIKASIEASLDRLSEAIELTASPEEVEALQVLFDQIRGTYSTEIGVLSFGLPEMSLFFTPFGWDLEIGELYQLEDTLPAPLGGPPVPAVAHFGVTDPDPSDSIYTFNWTQGFAGRAAEQAIFESLLILSLQTGGTQPTFEDVRGIERQDEGVFTLDTENWSLTDLRFLQYVTNQGSTVLDSTEFSLLP